MFLKNTIGILTTYFILSFAASAQQTEAIEHLIDNERYASAEAILEKRIGAEGTAPALNYLIVKTYLSQDKAERAKEFIKKYDIGESPDDNPLDRIAYARYLLQQGNVQEANKIYKSILDRKKNRRDASILTAMADANISEENGDLRQAIDWLNMAEKRDKNNPDIFILKGLAYRKLGDASAAYQAYQHALKRNKNNVKAHYLLGKIFTAQKNTEIYLKHFMAVYAIDSTYAPVLEELYNHYYYVNVNLAKNYLEKYIANSDYSIQNDYRMTDIYYLTGNYKHAIEAAKKIVDKEKNKAQPRLYKLMAYSCSKSGDTLQALRHIGKYFSLETPQKLIAPDFELRALLTATQTGAEKEAIAYYEIATEIDTLIANKIKYANAIIALYKKLGNDSRQAHWLGKLYLWKHNSNNIDLFNWGLAHYTAGEYPLADSIFGIYTNRYPSDIYGYYWRAQSNAAIDTAAALGLAVPHYLKMIEIGEQKPELYRKMLLKAYGYLGGYEANTKKDYTNSLNWFEKYLALDSDNIEAKRYAEMLRNWLNEQQQNK